MKSLGTQQMGGAFDYFSSETAPFGISFGEWTIRWWRWALGIPLSISPIVDPSGIHANLNQAGNVRYLAGKPADGDPNVPCRRCAFPYGTAVLFPLINCEANQLEYPDMREEQLIEDVLNHMELIAHLRCSINGEVIPAQRVQSDPKIFSLYINPENIFNIPCGGITLAAADGYWIFLKELEKGEYQLEFSGSCSGGIRYSGSKYILNIY